MTRVYIPTRSRAHLLRKTLPRWAEQDAHVVLVVEPTRAERELYQPLADEFAVDLFYLEKPNVGMGRIRQAILEDARYQGEDAFVQADDDSYPAKGDVASLCRTVLNGEVVGCGASSSYHGLMIGNEVLKTEAQFPIAGGFGHIMFAINTTLALSVGGYPEWATAWGEDTELQRQAIAEGMPWYYDTTVRMGSVAKRYSPGGLAAQYTGKRRRIQERVCHQKIYERWPEYISKPETGRFRCSWKKMMDTFVPDWRDEIPTEVTEAMNS